MLNKIKDSIGIWLAVMQMISALMYTIQEKIEYSIVSLLLAVIFLQTQHMKEGWKLD